MVTTKTCEVCERTFETRIDNAKRCKTCNDRRKRKAESKVTINREQIDAWICRIALPENRFSLWSTGLHAEVEVAQRKQDTPEAGGYPDGMAAAWRLADARDYRDAAE